MQVIREFVISQLLGVLMNFDQWEIDITAGTATHETGFTLRIEGNPRDPSDVYPGKFPLELSYPDQAKLLRKGLEALAKASNAKDSWVLPKADLISPAAREREALAKQFAEREDKPVRPKLSLKK